MHFVSVTFISCNSSITSHNLYIRILGGKFKFNVINNKNGNGSILCINKKKNSWIPTIYYTIEECLKSKMKIFLMLHVNAFSWIDKYGKYI